MDSYKSRTLEQFISSVLMDTQSQADLIKLFGFQLKMKGDLVDHNKFSVLDACSQYSTESNDLFLGVLGARIELQHWFDS